MPKPATKKTVAPPQMEFDFIKSNFFRVVRGDGAFGGIAPNGAIHMGIFSERTPFPQKTVHNIGPTGDLGSELREQREGRKAIIREMEVDVVLEIAQAIALRQWLDERIQQYATLIGPLPSLPAKANSKAQ
jgi:hypothetical protein